MSDSHCNCCCCAYLSPPWWVTMGYVPPGGSPGSKPAPANPDRPPGGAPPDPATMPSPEDSGSGGGSGRQPSPDLGPGFYFPTPKWLDTHNPMRNAMDLAATGTGIVEGTATHVLTDLKNNNPDAATHDVVNGIGNFLGTYHL